MPALTNPGNSSQLTTNTPAAPRAWARVSSHGMPDSASHGSANHVPIHNRNVAPTASVSARQTDERTSGSNSCRAAAI